MVGRFRTSDDVCVHWIKNGLSTHQGLSATLPQTTQKSKTDGGLRQGVLSSWQVRIALRSWLEAMRLWAANHSRHQPALLQGAGWLPRG